ncbi:hypothetical protein KI387_023224, partial [Taxus chinensis]
NSTAAMPPHDNSQLVMTKKQMDTLRRQISVFSTICSQLVEMHKAMSQQASASSLEHMLDDPVSFGPGSRPPARQRWTPSQTQLHILERLYSYGNGTPNKQNIKKITSELIQHGPISEMNVYNWFQNRKARAKRKLQLLPHKEGDSEVDTDGESCREKKTQTEDEMNKEDESAWMDEKTAEAYESKHNIFLMGSEQADANPQINVRNQCIFLMGSEQAEAKPQIHGINHEMFNVGPCMPVANAQTGEKSYGMESSKPHSTDQQQFNDSQDNVSSLIYLQSEADVEADALLERPRNSTIACTANEISVSNQQEFGVMTVLLDGKWCEVPIGVVDVRKMFGDNALLLDSHGHVVPTNDAGITFHPLHASESYSLIRFIKMDEKRSKKRLYTYTRICVEVDLSKGLYDKMELIFEDFKWVHVLDYANNVFRCRLCRQTGYLHDACPQQHPMARNKKSPSTKMKDSNPDHSFSGMEASHRASALQSNSWTVVTKSKDKKGHFEPPTPSPWASLATTPPVSPSPWLSPTTTPHVSTFRFL